MLLRFRGKAVIHLSLGYYTGTTEYDSIYLFLKRTVYEFDVFLLVYAVTVTVVTLLRNEVGAVIAEVFE